MPRAQSSAVMRERTSSGLPSSSITVPAAPDFSVGQFFISSTAKEPAAGTILGGVWADYSWGRFWGWDPKEVWALIALLLYLAVLHGRYAGWLKGFGFAATTVCCFLGVERWMG